MQQIYRHSDEQFEVYTTVFSPQVSRSRSRHVEASKVVAVASYRGRWPKELDLEPGDLIQVLFREDRTWWFGRRPDGSEGYFPSGCVEPLQARASSRDSSTPVLVRRGSVPVVVTAPGAPCGCTSGHSAPRLLRRDSVHHSHGLDRPLPAPGHPLTPGLTPAPPAVAHSSPSLLHRILAKSRRKSCPHLPQRLLEPSVNTGFQPD